MVGLGETDMEIIETMEKMSDLGITIFNIGQYLQPTVNHLPVQRFVHPHTFEMYKDKEWYNTKFHYFFFSFYIIIGFLFMIFGLLGDVLVVFLENLKIEESLIQRYMNKKSKTYAVKKSHFHNIHIFLTLGKNGKQAKCVKHFQ